MTAARRLRAVFLGTPDFAIPSLRAVLDEVEVLAVVTQPDRPRGRGRQVAPPPVAAVARALGLRVLQPTRLNDPAVPDTLRTLRPDIIMTVAYGKIIPPAILTLPPLGCINVHPSLLPKYRGASPIQSAIADGQRETGVTIMYQSEALDAGDIILQRRVPIEPHDTAQTLEARLADEGARALVEALRLIAGGTAPRFPQDASAATYVKKLTKENGRLDWTRPARALANVIRAMDPWPSAYTTHRGRLLKIWKGAAIEHRPPGPARPGTVVEVRRRGGVGGAPGARRLCQRLARSRGSGGARNRARPAAPRWLRAAGAAVGDRTCGDAGDQRRVAPVPARGRHRHGQADGRGDHPLSWLRGVFIDHAARRVQRQSPRGSRAAGTGARRAAGSRRRAVGPQRGGAHLCRGRGGGHPESAAIVGDPPVSTGLNRPARPSTRRCSWPDGMVTPEPRHS